MVPYLVLYSYIIAAFVSNWKSISISNRVIRMLFDVRVVFILLFLFAGLRGNDDGDYFTYIKNVVLINDFQALVHPVDFPFEFGYRLLAYLVNLVHLPAQAVIMAMNAISIYSVYRFVVKYSKNPYLSAILFFPILLIFDMHHSRSAVAMSLGLWFFAFLYEKKILPAFIMLALAFLFHRTALILLILVPFFAYKNFENIQQKISNKRNIKIIALIVAIFLFVVFDPLNIFISILNNPFTNTLHYKMTAYLADGKWSYPFKIYDPRFILMICIYIFFVKTYDYKDKFNNKLMLTLLLSILSVLMFKRSTILTIRIYNYFYQFVIVLIPNILHTDLRLNFKEDSRLLTFFDEKLGIQENTILQLASILLLLAYIAYTLALIFKQVDYYFCF